MVINVQKNAKREYRILLSIGCMIYHVPYRRQKSDKIVQNILTLFRSLFLGKIGLHFGERNLLKRGVYSQNV